MADTDPMATGILASEIQDHFGSLCLDVEQVVTISVPVVPVRSVLCSMLQCVF